MSIWPQKGDCHAYFTLPPQPILFRTIHNLSIHFLSSPHPFLPLSLILLPQPSHRQEPIQPFPVSSVSPTLFTLSQPLLLLIITLPFYSSLLLGYDPIKSIFPFLATTSRLPFDFPYISSLQLSVILFNLTFFH